MKKIIALILIALFAFTGCASIAEGRKAKAMEKEYNYNRAQQQSNKGFKELDSQ